MSDFDIIEEDDIVNEEEMDPFKLEDDIWNLYQYMLSIKSTSHIVYQSAMLEKPNYALFRQWIMTGNDIPEANLLE